MKKLPSFAPVASGRCMFQFQNKSTKKCMRQREDGVLASATCDTATPEKTHQELAVVGGKLTFVRLSKTDFHAPHIWIDEPMDSVLPTTVPVLPGIDPKMAAKVMQSYDRSGFVFEDKYDRFKKYKDGKATSDCLATAKKGTQASAKKLNDLQHQYIGQAVQWTGIYMASQINHALKSQADAIKKNVDMARVTYEKAAAPGALTTAHCGSSSSQKWEALPVPRTTWKQK